MDKISTGRPLLLSIAWRVRQISEELENNTEQIRKKCTNETPVRLPRSSYKCAPSPPWIWRKATWTNSPSSIPKVAFVVFFIQYLMMAVERILEAHKLKIVNDLWAHAMSGLKEQGDLFWMLTHQETQSGNFDNFFHLLLSDRLQLIAICCKRRVVWTEPSHVTFSRTCVHSFQCRTWHWLKVSCAHHVMSSCVWLCVWSDTLRPSTLLCTLSPSPLIFLFILLFFIFSFHVGWFDEKSQCVLPRMRS